MAHIDETALPGVGVRHDFITRSGVPVGVVTHRTGYRELLIYDAEDPDRCQQVLRLEEDDSRTLSELLGASQVTDTLAHLRQSVQGLVIDWLPVKQGAACAGHTIQETLLRSRTGTSIVAVLRGEEAIPSPSSDFRLEIGDTAVVVGTPEGVRQSFTLLVEG